MSFDILVEQFQRELPFYLRCSEVTARKTAYQVQRYFRAQSGSFPGCFTRESVMDFLTELSTSPPRRRNKQRREASTVNDVLKSLRRFARWAVSVDLLDSDPTDGIKGLREESKVILAPEVSVVAKVLSVAKDHGETEELRARNLAMVLMLADIGMRAAELLAIDVSDALDGRQVAEHVVLHGKGGKERLAALNPPVRAAVTRYMKLRRPASNEQGLFVDIRGERVTYVALRNMVRELCRIAGVTMNLHDFRRFSHTMLWMGGIDQIDGMLLSGHASVQVYETYIRGAMQLRAVREHRRRSPLAEVLAAD